MAILIVRKTWRLCAIVFPLTYYFSSKITTTLIIIPFLLIFIILEILRFSVPGFNEIFFKVFKNILKEKERNNFLTTTLFLASTLLTVILFKQYIAIVSLLFLIFGDTASIVFGLRFGRTKLIGRRTLEGSLAFFFTCLIIGVIINFTKISLPWPVIFSGAIAATIIELLPLPVDDNFTIALFSGIIMTIVSSV